MAGRVDEFVFSADLQCHCKSADGRAFAPGLRRNAGRRPRKDGRGIDLLLVLDRKIHPVEVRKSASPRREWAGPFSALERLAPGASEGGVVCLCRQRLPITKTISAIPAGLV